MTQPARPAVPKRRTRQGETTRTHEQSVSAAITPAASRSRPTVEARLPHERDESRHSQRRDTSSQVTVGEQAYADSTGPVQDTDRGPILDEVYNRTLAPDRARRLPRR